MLKNTFLHIPGIGAITEARLWEAGILNWDNFVEPYPINLSPNRVASLRRCLDESKRHLQSDNPNYFANQLPSNQQ